jgi:hypothetical protein
LIQGGIFVVIFTPAYDDKVAIVGGQGPGNPKVIPAKMGTGSKPGNKPKNYCSGREEKHAHDDSYPLLSRTIHGVLVTIFELVLTLKTTSDSPR